ncbi:ficolin-2-like [Branchiostoma floridae]|uniref:Ficolin-2-like n=1 Tax=Branchiostoma floridae TaxID=7739 RepID=A0A9J7NCL2_BRAFL|nr:ficolin-2-like [Branchiostoma floridae]
MKPCLAALVLLCSIPGLAYGKCALDAALAKNLPATLEGSACPPATDPKLVALKEKVKKEKTQQDVTINMLQAMAAVEAKATDMLEAKLKKLEVKLSVLEGEIKRKKAELKVEDKTPKKQGDASKGDFPDCGGIKIMDPSMKSGQYQIKIKGNTQKTPVKCDMETMGGGWTIILGRDASQTKVVDFNQDLAAYKKGFDNPPETNFILGLDHMTKLTSQGKYQLLVEMEDFDGVKASAMYKEFKVGDEASKFKLTIGEYDEATSTAGDALFFHNGKPFSTKGKDNDGNTKVDWAVVATGGWWYHENGYAAHPTGQQLDKTKKADMEVQTINWLPWRGYEKLKTISFKVRKSDFKLVY